MNTPFNHMPIVTKGYKGGKFAFVASRFNFFDDFTFQDLILGREGVWRIEQDSSQAVVVFGEAPPGPIYLYEAASDDIQKAYTTWIASQVVN